MTALARSTFVRCMILVWVALGPLLSGASLASAQSGGWSKPVPLSSAETTSWFPDVAADLSGEVHVAWSSGVALGIGQAYDTVVYTKSQDGSSWSAPLEIVAFPWKGTVTRPTLLADPAGLLHMTFKSYTLYYSHALVQSLTARSLVPYRSISSGDNGYFSRMAMDPQGRIHLAYTEYADTLECPECLHVYYRDSEDDGITWSYPVDISRIPTGAAKPCIALDSLGVVHVVWEAGRGGDLGQLAEPTTVMYAASDDGGRTWRVPTQLAPPGVRARHVALGLDRADEVIVVWLGVAEDRIQFQTSSDHGLTWSAPQPIPDVFGGWSVYQGRTDSYSMVTDSAGLVHLLAVGRTSAAETSLSLLHLTWDGTTWSTPEIIFTWLGDVPEWPRAAIGLGNRLHVVWFVRDQAHIWGGEGASRYRIWYANRMLDLPAQEPVVFPTLTPTGLAPVEPTASALVLSPPPTPWAGTLPLASLAPGDAVLPADTENRSLLLILQAMVPVGLLLGAVVLAVNLRRR